MKTCRVTSRPVRWSIAIWNFATVPFIIGMSLSLCSARNHGDSSAQTRAFRYTIVYRHRLVDVNQYIREE